MDTPCDALGDLITGFWGEVVVELTPVCWSWVPSIPVISLRRVRVPVAEAQRHLAHAGYVEISSEAVATVCQFLGAGVLLVVAMDETVAVWARRETLTFATQYPIVLGFGPLIDGRVADVMSVPPLAYGRMALRYDQPEPITCSADQLSTAGRENRLLVQAILEHLMLAREQRHHPQMFEVLMGLFSWPPMVVDHALCAGHQTTYVCA